MPSVCPEIMLKQSDEVMIRSSRLRAFVLAQMFGEA
jgi:hypothetical protein